MKLLTVFHCLKNNLLFVNLSGFYSSRTLTIHYNWLFLWLLIQIVLTQKRGYLLLFVFPVRLVSLVFIVFFQVIINNILALMLTRPHHLQNSCQAPVQSKEVRLREEGGHGRQRILGQGLSHHITQPELREGQQSQAKERGASDPARHMKRRVVKTGLSWKHDEIFCIFTLLTCSIASREQVWTARPESDAQTWRQLTINPFQMGPSCQRQVLSRQFFTVLTRDRDPDAAKRSRSQTFQMSHSDVCPCCLWMETIVIIIVDVNV